jgi:hypothetical protein
LVVDDGIYYYPTTTNKGKSYKKHLSEYVLLHSIHSTWILLQPIILLWCNFYGFCVINNNYSHVYISLCICRYYTKNKTDVNGIIFASVSKGSSDKIEEPSIVVGVANMPRDKELYDLSQDTKLFELKTYTVTVTYDDTETEQFIVTQKIINDLEGIRSFMDTYYD